jgi:thaumarchaeosortase
VLWEWHDSRKRLVPTRSKWRLLAVVVVTVILLVYYYERVANEAWTDSLRVVLTSQFGVSEKAPLSFLLAADYLLYSLYSIFMVALFYGPGSIRLMTLPTIYSAGSGILDLMDAFYPEDSLAFMQTWVYVIWNVVAGILCVLGYHVTAPGSSALPSFLLVGNRLSLWGYKGFANLLIFWPSSGVVSMIMYGLVLVILMVKLDAPRKRKLVYATIGAAGTYFANVVRITLIVLYVTYVSLDVKAFHDAIGEVIFLSWIVIFLYFVVSRENRLARMALTAKSQEGPTVPSVSLGCRVSSARAESLSVEVL